MRRYGGAVLCSVVAALAGTALTLLLHTQGHVVERADLYILLFWAPALLLVERLRRSEGQDRPVPRKVWPLLTLTAVLVLFLFASIIRHKWFYFLHWLPQASGKMLFQSSAFWFVFLALLLLPFFLRRNRRTALLLGLILATSQVATLARFLYVTGGDVLARDDHPSFVFRLWQFRETFPQLMTYNPYWNGGVAEHMHVVSGTLGPGLLLWPLWHFAHIPDVYTVGVGLIFIVIVPFIAAASMRAVNGDRIAQWTAGLLALGVSQHFFLWLMQFGTIGANLAAAFIVPVSALLYRFICLDRRTFVTGLFLVLSMSFLLLYPPGAIMALPVALTALLHARRWTIKKVQALAWCGLAIFVLHGRTLILLLAHDDVLHFCTGAGHGATTGAGTPFSTAILNEGWLFLLAHLREGHPILLLLGVVGVFFAPRGTIRTWYLPILLGFALLVGWGRHWAPDLELSRMAIPMMFAVIPPAALAVSAILRTSHSRAAILRTALIALLILTGLNTYRLYDRQGYARYHSMMPDIERMIEWIQSDVPEGGRVLFAGHTIHAYGGGHVSFLPLLSGREMMACDYYHFSPKEVEYNYPPQPFRESADTIFEFFEIYNVTAVTTIHEKWMKSFRAHPDRYTEVTPWGESDTAFFVVNRTPSQFVSNEGKVKAHFNRLDITVNDPNEEAVIVYNWAERLRVEPPAELFPYDAGRGVTLIGVRPNGRTDISIRYPGLL